MCSLLYSPWGVSEFSLCPDDVLMTCSLCRSPPWWSRWSSTSGLDAKLEDSRLAAHSNIVIIGETVFEKKFSTCKSFFYVFDLHVTILSALHALLELRALNQRNRLITVEAVAGSHLYTDLFMFYKFQLTVFELIHIASNML